MARPPQDKGAYLACLSCGSEDLDSYDAEVAVYLPYLNKSAGPHLFLYPKLLICMSCGFAGFAVSETTLNVLAQARSENLSGDAFCISLDD